MNNTCSYTIKAPCVFSVWPIWAFINNAKHRHLEFLLLIPMENFFFTSCPPAAFHTSSESRVCKQPIEVKWEWILSIYSWSSMYTGTGTVLTKHLKNMSSHFDLFWPLMLDCADKIENVLRIPCGFKYSKTNARHKRTHKKRHKCTTQDHRPALALYGPT